MRSLRNVLSRMDEATSGAIKVDLMEHIASHLDKSPEIAATREVLLANLGGALAGSVREGSVAKIVGAIDESIEQGIVARKAKLAGASKGWTI